MRLIKIIKKYPKLLLITYDSYAQNYSIASIARLFGYNDLFSEIIKNPNACMVEFKAGLFGQNIVEYLLYHIASDGYYEYLLEIIENCPEVLTQIGMSGKPVGFYALSLEPKPDPKTNEKINGPTPFIFFK